eukprot:5159347-Pleurochrysis_carterae.AAC.3
MRLWLAALTTTMRAEGCASLHKAWLLSGKRSMHGTAPRRHPIVTSSVRMGAAHLRLGDEALLEPDRLIRRAIAADAERDRPATPFRIGQACVQRSGRSLSRPSFSSDTLTVLAPPRQLAAESQPPRAPPPLPALALAPPAPFA